MEKTEWFNFFFQWSATLFWIFQKTPLYKRYDLYEDASLACFDQFLCPGNFFVLAAKRRQTCISI